jgi:hypothetical protein
LIGSCSFFFRPVYPDVVLDSVDLDLHKHIQ